MKMYNLSGVVWVTGLPGAGKTTFAKTLRTLLIKNHHVNTTLLDGDELRAILGNFDYCESTRHQLAMTYAKLCNLLANQNNLVICATVSMFDDVRQWSRENNQHYCEVFLSVSENILLNRDQKGLYSANVDSENTLVSGLSDMIKFPQESDFIYQNMLLNEIQICATQVVEKVLLWK